MTSEQPPIVNLLTDISRSMNDPTLPNWSEIRGLLPTSALSRPIHDLVNTHDGIFYKIRFADYHLFILRQIYRPNMTDPRTDTQNWARAELHSIIYNLYSALDSLGYEINLAYEFKMKHKKINIYHPKDDKARNNCIRCKIKNEKDAKDLARYIEESLGEPWSWFYYFHRLRMQITHRNFPSQQPVVGVGKGRTLKINLPDDPENMDPDPICGYCRKLELLEYCEKIREDVSKFIENVYFHIKPKIIERYSLR